MEHTHSGVIPHENSTYDLEHELFHHLIDGLKDYAIFMITPEGKIGTWNPGVKRIFGYGETEFISEPFSLIFTEADVKLGIHKTELENARKHGRAEDERWHRRKDGSTFWGSGLVTVIKDSKGVLKGYAKILRNQTEKKKMEEELIDHTNSLAIANRELTNFAGIVSHDLQAPLQTLFGFANLLKEKADKNRVIDEEAKESVEYIADGAERMMKLVRQLLKEASVPETTKELKLVDTDKIVRNVLKELSHTIQNKAVKIFTGNLPSVWADEIQLNRVFQNIIENACKYSRQAVETKVDITSDDFAEYTRFAITDNGIGIKPDDKRDIFTLFQRAENSGDNQGHGIGLGTARKIIEGLGGKIWVESELNKGSTFYFTIPKHADDNVSLNSEISLRT